jgi:MarR family transcriptional regulator, 2-MHQ and catechol-resistance regulon repressor
MPTHYRGTDEERLALDLFIKLHRAAGSITTRSLCPIARAGLTDSQFGILETLYHLGPMMPSQLADKLLKSRNNFTLVIDNLEKMGYVRRERSQIDRRAITIQLTDTGREKIADLFPQFAAGLAKQTRVLTPDEQKELARLLKILGTGVRPEVSSRQKEE